MTGRWLLAAFHLLALGVGLGAVWARGRALRGALDTPSLRRVFYADTWWGVAAFLWIGTGVLRGTVTFAGTPPEGEDVERSRCHGGAATIHVAPVVVGDRGQLKDVMVYVKDPAVIPAGEPVTPAVLDQVFRLDGILSALDRLSSAVATDAEWARQRGPDREADDRLRALECEAAPRLPRHLPRRPQPG